MNTIHIREKVHSPKAGVRPEFQFDMPHPVFLVDLCFCRRMDWVGGVAWEYAQKHESPQPQVGLLKWHHAVHELLLPPSNKLRK